MYPLDDPVQASRPASGLLVDGSRRARVPTADELAAGSDDVDEGAAADGDFQHAAVQPRWQIEVILEHELCIRLRDGKHR